MRDTPIRYVSHRCRPGRRALFEGAVALAVGLVVPAGIRAGEVRQMRGAVFVDGRPLGDRGSVTPSARIRVAHGASLDIVVGDDAYRLRGGTALDLDSEDGVTVRVLRLLTGGLLAVFGRRETTVLTSVATIGIRGTGLYLSSRPNRLYTCTCYGETMLAAGGERMRVSATHHDAHYVDRAPGGGATSMRAAEVLDHDDAELRELEGYVGRKPAFD